VSGQACNQQTMMPEEVSGQACNQQTMMPEEVSGQACNQQTMMPAREGESARIQHDSHTGGKQTRVHCVARVLMHVLAGCMALCTVSHDLGCIARYEPGRLAEWRESWDFRIEPGRLAVRRES
jgi:hypothetical protein